MELIKHGRCRDVNEFEKLNRIGEGSYGTVYSARDKNTNSIVALKRVLLHNENSEGFPLTSLREIKLLQRVSNQNCVRLLDIAVGTNRSSVFLVFEYYDHDLASLLNTTRIHFTESETKRIAIQILRAIEHLHDLHIIHRDIKMSNILYSNMGEIKLADFGLARQIGSPTNSMTPEVVTLWYRPPEILLGCSKYSVAVDMWACGCIIAELMLNEPLFPGKSNVEQINLIFSTLGRPDEQTWASMKNLSTELDKMNFNIDYKRFYDNNLRRKLQHLSKEGLDLMNKLLTYDPEKRITASEALKHEYFRSPPFPVQEKMMPTFPSSHVKHR